MKLIFESNAADWKITAKVRVDHGRLIHVVPIMLLSE